jgi:Ca2+-binding RTX toxin-like protein
VRGASGTGTVDNGDKGSDILSGNAGADFVMGGLGPDRLSGGGGGDNLSDGAAEFGQDSSVDILRAGAGNDTIFALDGSKAKDILRCGGALTKWWSTKGST